MHFHPVQPGNLRLKHLAFAIVLGAGVSHGQTVIDVGGAGIIGDTTLTTSGGTAKLSVGGDTWKTNGGTGAPVSTTLASPAVAVPATGNVTLTFTHRYDFESGWDGGAVFVSVNGNPAVYLNGTAFSSNGYVGTTTTGDGSAAWSGGENVFYGQSADYSTPALITSVADLGSLTAGDAVSVQFKGEWDDQQVNGPPAWEIGSVKLTDAGATDFLDVDFAADGPSGFSVSNSGALPGPWTYNAGVLRFELDADADTADRIKPDIAGSTIDLNNAAIRVVLLNGEVEVNDTFSLFDLSGGTTLTGSLGSITLPAVGTWDTSELAAGGNGTITLLTSDIADGTWITDASGNWSDTSNWLDEIYANGRGKTAHINLDITGNRTVTIDTQSRTVGTLNFGDPDNSHQHTLAASGGASLSFNNDGSGAALNVTGAPSGTGYPSSNKHQITAPVTLADNLTVNANQVRMSGIISQSGGDRAITLNSGILILEGHHTFAGGVTLNAGELAFPITSRDGSGVVQSLGSGTVTINGGRLGFQHNNVFQINNQMVLNANFSVYRGITGTTGWTQNGNVTLGGNVAVNSPNNFFNWVVNGSIGETGGDRGLSLTGNGLSTFLNNANSFSGGVTHSSSGTLHINQAQALGTGALTITGGTRLIDNSSGAAITLGNNNPVTLANTLRFVGTNDLNMGAGEVTLSGGNRTVQVDAGTLTFGGAVGQDASNRALIKTGAGTLVLGGDNMYLGTTTVNAGTLLINGDSSAATGVVNVTAGTLGGSGTLGGNVTVAAAANLAPGPSVGKLTIGGNLTLSVMAGDAGKLIYELGSIAASDQIAVTGSLAIGTDVLGFNDFEFTALSGLQNGIYKLITGSAAPVGSLDPADLTGPIGTGSGALQISDGGTGNDIELVVSGIGAGSPYDTWSGGAPFDGDANGDGVSNGLAFLLGAVSPAVDATGLMPTITEAGGGLDIATFSMLNAASRGSATLSVEHSSSLATGSWTSVAVPDTAGETTVGAVTFHVTLATPPSVLNTVTATISPAAAAGGKLFGRLKAENP